MSNIPQIDEDSTKKVNDLQGKIRELLNGQNCAIGLTAVATVYCELCFMVNIKKSKAVKGLSSLFQEMEGEWIAWKKKKEEEHASS